VFQTLKSWFKSLAEESVALGTVANLAEQIQRLLESPPGSYLIVAVAPLETGAFLQFTADATTIQLDHPLITPEQMGREQSLRSILTSVGLVPYDTRASDGSRFLDCDLPRDAAGAAILVRRVLEPLFATDSSSELRFVGGNGLVPQPNTRLHPTAAARDPG
jgi:hypothetical protein